MDTVSSIVDQTMADEAEPKKNCIIYVNLINGKMLLHILTKK